jgi:hypothetical protein
VLKGCFAAPAAARTPPTTTSASHDTDHGQNVGFELHIDAMKQRGAAWQPMSSTEAMREAAPMPQR